MNAEPQSATDVAAVDLGSNSFRMVVARESDGQLRVIDRLREPVRLAAGVTPDGALETQAGKRALACLSRFGQRVRGIPAERLRAVGTNAMRRLRDDGAFVAAASRALGHEVEIISGWEEARMIYAGVTLGLGETPPRRLVVDIGGGSTELIIGRGIEPRLLESVELGCVSHTARYFGDGQITAERMRSARLDAWVKLEYLQRRYRRTGWDLALGSSGCVRGVWRVMRAQGWADEWVTREALERVIALTVEAGTVEHIDFPGLREDRQPVFAGGLAVLAGVFDALGLETMQTSDKSLREGVVSDLLGRLSDHDLRAESVAAQARRYSVDRGQARRVEDTALRLFRKTAKPWSLDRDEGPRLLGWAAQLHEIGLAIGHGAHHRHGEYILLHGDLPGFSRLDQQLLATLVRLQCGKFSAKVIDALPADRRKAMRRLAVLFRLAVLLHRSRTSLARLSLHCTVRNAGLQLRFPDGWLARHALTRADLEQERCQLQKAAFSFSFE